MIQQLSSLQLQYFRLYKCRTEREDADMYLKYSGRLKNVIFSLIINKKSKNQNIHRVGFIIFFEVVFVELYTAIEAISRNKKSKFTHHFGTL